jgi:hypothetical protein
MNRMDIAAGGRRAPLWRCPQTWDRSVPGRIAQWEKVRGRANAEIVTAIGAKDIRAHPRLTSGKTSLGHHGTQSHGCAGQTVRPSLHSISQALAGMLLILSYSVFLLMFEVREIT